jgi:hypothetical protein
MHKVERKSKQRWNAGIQCRVARPPSPVRIGMRITYSPPTPSCSPLPSHELSPSPSRRARTPWTLAGSGRAGTTTTTIGVGRWGVSPRGAGQLASHLDDRKLLGASPSGSCQLLCVLTGETSLRSPRHGRHPSSSGLLMGLLTACSASRSAGYNQCARFYPNGCKLLNVRPSHGSRDTAIADKC